MSLSGIEIILVEPIYPGNVGAIARSAANFGVDTIKIVGTLDCACDDAKQMSLYGYPLLQKAQFFGSLAEAVAPCSLVFGTVQQERYNRAPPAPAWDTLARYRERILAGRTAIVFGREDNGLTREEIDQCHVLTTIPTPTGLSFNLAHSVTVFLYELYHATTGCEPAADARKPDQADLNDLLELMESTLYAVGFFRRDRKVNTMIRIRDIVYRMSLNAADVPVLKALFYKINSFARRALPLLPREQFQDCSISDAMED